MKIKILTITLLVGLLGGCGGKQPSEAQKAQIEEKTLRCVAAVTTVVLTCKQPPLAPDAAHEGTPDANVKTSSLLPFANFANVLAPEAYKTSPAAVITDCGEFAH